MPVDMRDSDIAGAVAKRADSRTRQQVRIGTIASSGDLPFLAPPGLSQSCTAPESSSFSSSSFSPEEHRVLDRLQRQKVAQIRPPVALYDMHHLNVGIRNAKSDEPRLVIEAHRIDNQRGSFPAADRVAERGWFQFLG